MPSATVDDDQVIAALRSGDQAVFAAVTERFRRPARPLLPHARIVRRRRGDRAGDLPASLARSANV